MFTSPLSNPLSENLSDPLAVSGDDDAPGVSTDFANYTDEEHYTKTANYVD